MTPPKLATQDYLTAALAGVVLALLLVGKLQVSDAVALLSALGVGVTLGIKRPPGGSGGA